MMRETPNMPACEICLLKHCRSHYVTVHALLDQYVMITEVKEGGDI